MKLKRISGLSVLNVNPDTSLEKECDGIVAGIDEAGRGPWAGPVVAAAVILDMSNIPDGIKDSKKLSSKKREFLFNQIYSTCKVGVGIIDEKQIDEINILEATKLAMRLAIENLPQLPDIALVDGNQPPRLPCVVRTVINGDNKSISIAAASIIAKVTRDRIMLNLHSSFPQYGWDRNAGYGTKEHQQRLFEFGITQHHRRSFAPIRKMLNEEDA